MFRKWIAALMTLVLMVSMIPTAAVSAAAADIVTITVVDESGNPIEGATVTATRNYTRSNRVRNQTVSVSVAGNGIYTYDTSRYTTGTTNYYTVSVEKSGYTAVTQQVDPATRAVLITLAEYVEPDNWVPFDIYYIATGITPDSFTGAGDPADYGPSGNDVPLVTVNVNISELKRAKYADRVVYEENQNGNSYHFIPAGDVESDNVTEEQKRELIKPFWEAVVECMDEESKEAFEATGLDGSFIGYVLKNQGSIQNPDNHCDGILTVEPPVYVVEMNDRGTYFGGFANDEETSQYTKLTDVLTAYNNHFKQSIHWVSNGDGTYSGSYVEGKYQYYLKISQTNYGPDLVQPEVGEEYVSYKKQTDQYYLATFDAETVKVEQYQFTVSYTDGMNNKVFNSQVTAVLENAAIPVFSGEVVRENYNHIGWMLEGGDGKVMTQDEILETYPTVNRDLTFIAVYALKPATFAGVVEVILNGSYANGEVSGERVDITAVKDEDTALAVSADGKTFIALDHTAEGIYSAHLENGTYQIYYYDGTSYELSSEQLLDISDAPRTRYLFFNTVDYDLNGGVGGPASLREFHRTGTAVQTASEVPVLDGYRFLGWKDQDGVLYQSGAVLTAAIGQAYILTAQWEKILYADVDVTLILDHTAAGGGKNINYNKNLEIDLTYRPVNSAEDYVEVVTKESVKSDWYANGETVDDVTTVTYESLFHTLSTAYEYSANIFLSEYEVKERTVTVSADAEGNVTYHVTVKMRFNPESFMLQYGIEERIENDALVPKAVDIKVLAWYNPSAEIAGAPDYVLWYPIFEHVHNSHDALFTAEDAQGDQVGFGSYNVWGWENKDAGIPYYYRIGTVGFTLADGTELTAVTEDGVNFVSVPSADGRYPAGAYTATLEQEGGHAPVGSALVGAHFDKNGQQNGTLTLVVESHPYSVTFDPNGGKLNGTEENLVIADQFTVPATDGYIPSRDGAYVFDRWVLLDENGDPTEETVTAGEALTRDITLAASWKEPLTVEGLVTVGATYEQLNEDGTYSIQEIYESDRPKTATILLQKIEPNGYTETVRSALLTLDYTDEEYYYLGERAVGVASYAFKDIPDDGTAYRIQMLLPNYISFFQNEPASLKKPLDYPTYTADAYTVVWGTSEPTVGTANIHNHFKPDEFELTYTVDASAIGEGFRPQSAEVLITADGVPSGYEPSEWAVISQMIINKEYVGDDVVLDVNGIGNGSDNVWISSIDGVTYYQYGIRLYKVTADGVTVEYTEDLPYTVSYQAPVHYHYGAQSEELKAVLTPKSYEIRYELGGGKATGEYPTVHTWSYETSLTLADPTFTGFVFDGWYLDADFTKAAPASIDAAVAEDTTLYAKWVQTMDVVDLTVIVNHEQEGVQDGLAGNYNKTLYTQLTYDLRSNEGTIDRVFADAEGYAKAYPNGIWHTNGDMVKQDVFQIPAYYTNLSAEYDYAVNVSLDGYYVTDKTVTKTPQPDGSTLHKVVVTLQYNPELLDLQFYVRVEDGIEPPVSAEVKVTCWYDSPSAAVDWQWFRISQHEATTVTVTIDPETRIGYGTYPVWMWYDKEAAIPYHYRIEVLQLNLTDGTSVHMTETTDDVMYHGGGYHAEIETEGGRVPVIPGISATTELQGVYGVVNGNAYAQQGEVGAVIGRHDSVIFHANNLDYEGADAFRTYYHHAMPELNDGSYRLNEDGTVDTFYDIPTFDYTTHNHYIFKGWYMHPVSEEEPFAWTDAFKGSGDVYAHWIEVGEIEKEEADSKIVPDNTYHEYDLTGVQIRDQDLDEMKHYGNPASGLRFITVLSERVYGEINGIKGQQAEYGFVMAKSSTLNNNAAGKDGYTLQYKAANVNGVDTTSAYKYVQNIRCDGVVDHYEGESYRLYTAVITFNGVEGEAKEAAYATAFTARSYIRYTDANNLLRTYYNNYTGAAPVAGGCSTSFAVVQGMMGA